MDSPKKKKGKKKTRKKERKKRKTEWIPTIDKREIWMKFRNTESRREPT